MRDPARQHGDRELPGRGRLILLFLILVLAAGAASPAGPAASPADASPTANLDCAKGFDGIVASAMAEPGATVVTPRAGVPLLAVAVQTPGVMTVYSYTAATHPAHPFMARRRMVQRDGKMAVDMVTCRYGDRAASDRLTAQFTAMNNDLVRQMADRPPAP